VLLPLQVLAISLFVEKKPFLFCDMVCDSCQKKLGTVICPDPWKDGARNTTESGGRKINENKLLKANRKVTPYGAKGAAKVAQKCKTCKQQIHQSGNIYCNLCAYKAGVCSMCGTKILDIKAYKQTNI